MAMIRDLPKWELLAIMEHVPQRFWPPRPIRQDKATLVDAIERAHYADAGTRAALAAAWARRRAGI